MHDDATSPLLLVVEDEALLSIDAETTLREAGFEVRLASAGEPALLAIERGDINGLITDINLGDGPTGWDVARRARELMPDLPVVYLSGESSAQWASQGVPKSIMISKPYAPAQLVTAISTLLNAAPATET